jgi:hypothetical protein
MRMGRRGNDIRHEMYHPEKTPCQREIARSVRKVIKITVSFDNFYEFCIIAFK